MFYGLLGLCFGLTGALALTVRWAFGQIENTQILAANERDALHAAHIAQLSEFANRIQIPERQAHISASTLAPPSEPSLNPELEEELELIGKTR